MNNTQSDKIKINIKPEDLELQKCTCGSHIFIQGFTLNKITKIIGLTDLIPTPIFFCGVCGKEFNPEEVIKS